MLTREDLMAMSQLLDEKLDEKLKPIYARLDSLEARLEKAEEEIHKVQLHLENVTDKNICLLAENYVPAAKRYEEAEQERQTMKADLEVVKRVVAEHSEKLRALA